MTSSWEKQKNGWKPPQVPTQTKFTLHEAIASRVTSMPVHAGNDIEKPELKDRHEWLCSLAYATWDFEEIDSVDWNNYIYARRHDLP
jgi:hypothetical protein